MVHLDPEVLETAGASLATLEDGTLPDYELTVSELLKSDAAGFRIPTQPAVRWGIVRDLEPLQQCSV